MLTLLIIPFFRERSAKIVTSFLSTFHQIFNLPIYQPRPTLCTGVRYSLSLISVHVKFGKLSMYRILTCQVYTCIFTSVGHTPPTKLLLGRLQIFWSPTFYIEIMSKIAEGACVGLRNPLDLHGNINVSFMRHQGNRV